LMIQRPSCSCIDDGDRLSAARPAFECVAATGLPPINAVLQSARTHRRPSPTQLKETRKLLPRLLCGSLEPLELLSQLDIRFQLVKLWVTLNVSGTRRLASLDTSGHDSFRAHHPHQHCSWGIHVVPCARTISVPHQPTGGHSL
jgi:hypothetical protein